MYRGLNVITNKATVDEQGDVPHHLMSFLDIEETYDVARFVKEARHIAERECISRDRLPILVGGTTYYIQHLLFPGNVVAARGQEDAEQMGPFETVANTEPTVAVVAPFEAELLDAMENLSDANRLTWQAFAATSANTNVFKMPPPRDLWNLLHALDPFMARRWHPSDGRKIANSLRVIASTGKRHSDWIAEQEAAAAAGIQRGGATDNHVVHWSDKPIRVLLFLMYASPEELKERLNYRTGKMIERGLLQELRELRRLAAATSIKIDNTKGIFQSIGYKEFKPFLDVLEERYGSDASVGNLDVGELSAELRHLFERSLEDMKTATRQYAKKQLMWMKNKLLPELSKRKQRGEHVEIVLLDASEKDKWEERVRSPAIKALEAFLSGLKIPRECWDNEAYRREIEPLLQAEQPGSYSSTFSGLPASLSANTHILCPICTSANRNGAEVYFRRADDQRHRNGRPHRRALAWVKKQQLLQEGKRLDFSDEEICRKRKERAARRRERPEAAMTESNEKKKPD